MTMTTMAGVGVGVVMTSAMSAWAQERWIIETSNVVSPTQPLATVRLSVEFNPVDHAFAASLFTVRASEPGWSNPRHLIGPPNGPPLIVALYVQGITVGQIHFPPVVMANTANPIAAYEIDWSTNDFRPRLVTIETLTTRFDVYISDTSPASESRMATLMEGRGEIRVIPAPGALSVLGVLGLTAVRRRR